MEKRCQFHSEWVHYFVIVVQGHRMARKQMNIEVEDVLTVDVLTYSKYVQLIADGINGEGGNPEAAVTAPGKKQPLKKVKA